MERKSASHSLWTHHRKHAHSHIKGQQQALEWGSSTYILGISQVLINYFNTSLAAEQPKPEESTESKEGEAPKEAESTEVKEADSSEAVPTEVEPSSEPAPTEGEAEADQS